MSLVEKKSAAIKAVILDIDGVLTDGRVGYGAGEEIKFFHVRDGHAIKLAQRGGLIVGAISGRSAKANQRRAEELAFDFLFEGRADKRTAFDEVLTRFRLRPEECLYIGDDQIDIPVMRMAGIAATVADAPAEMDGFCDWRSVLPGGHGAVREIIERLLKEQGKWESLCGKYWS